jgi:hypothetical protein
MAVRIGLSKGNILSVQDLTSTSEETEDKVKFQHIMGTFIMKGGLPLESTKRAFPSSQIIIITMREYGSRNTTIFAILLNDSTTYFGYC